MITEEEPQQQQQQPHEEGFVERLFEEGRQGKQNDSHGNNARGNDEPRKESEIDKIKDYLKEDETLEEEGRTYGGLM